MNRSTYLIIYFDQKCHPKFRYFATRYLNFGWLFRRKITPLVRLISIKQISIFLISIKQTEFPPPYFYSALFVVSLPNSLECHTLSNTGFCFFENLQKISQNLFIASLCRLIASAISIEYFVLNSELFNYVNRIVIIIVTIHD